MSTSLSTDHQKGITTAGLGVFVLSFDAVLVKLVNSGAADTSFWRGALIFLSLMLLLVVSKKTEQLKQYLQNWQSAVVITLLYGLNTSLFVFCLSYTSTANTVVILSSSAFFAAFFSWLLLREKVLLRTWLAIIASVIGVLVVFSGALEQQSWFGDLLAICLALSMGLTFTLLRRVPELPRIPVIAFSGLVAMLCTAPFASPLALGTDSYLWLILMGMVQMPLASVLMLSATRYLSSPEVSLFLLIETVLGPLWVWFVFAEELHENTILGGSIILSAVILHSWMALSRPSLRAKSS